MSKKKQKTLSEKELKVGQEKILGRYEKKLGKTSPAQVFYPSKKTESDKLKEDKKVGDIWQDGEYWIEKLGENMYSRSRQHPEVWKERSKLVESIKNPTCECGKKIKNENEKSVFRARGKCYDCLADEELENHMSGKVYEQRVITKHDMILKDTMGNPVMSIAELEKELGKELTAEEINMLSKKNQKLDEN